MSQPQYSGSGFDPGNTPPAAGYMNPAVGEPVVDCEAAVTAALTRRAGLETALMVPNMSDAGTHAGPIGVDPGGINADS